MHTDANEADDLVARAARRVLRHLERSGDAAERAAAGSLAGEITRWQADRLAQRAGRAADARQEAAGHGR